jgi:hypothetical protein
LRHLTVSLSALCGKPTPAQHILRQKESDELMASHFDNTLSVHRSLRTRIIEEFQTINDSQLDLLSTFGSKRVFQSAIGCIATKHTFSDIRFKLTKHLP